MLPNPEGESLTQRYLWWLVSEPRWGRRGVWAPLRAARFCHNKRIKKLLIKLFWAWGGAEGREGAPTLRLPVVLCQGTSVSPPAAADKSQTDAYYCETERGMFKGVKERKKMCTSA